MPRPSQWLQKCEQRMKQVARNLTDATNGLLRGKRYLILDRDPLYTPAFRRMLKKVASTLGAKPRNFSSIVIWHMSRIGLTPTPWP